jgi:hypothetical protein
VNARRARLRLRLLVAFAVLLVVATAALAVVAIASHDPNHATAESVVRDVGAPATVGPGGPR